MSFLKAKDLDNIKNQDDCLGPNEYILKENDYRNMFISCARIEQSLGDYGEAIKGLWKEIKLSKQPQINPIDFDSFSWDEDFKNAYDTK